MAGGSDEAVGVLLRRNWNKLDAQYSTNVVLTAESVLPLTQENVAQVVFYDEGVGTSKFESLSGGMFGAGLLKNMADGYRFLIFNYSPGDEIYVFGFSRGAYTARSFVGLLYTSGILLRGYASKVNEAIELYRRRDTTPEFNEQVLCFRRDNSPDICVTIDEQQWRVKAGIPSQNTPMLQVRYLGVWDTVGALGVPSRSFISGPLDKKFQFHDTSLSAFVQSARHAVAIDERRKDFVPTLWDNTDALNMARTADPTAPDAPYQQRWFILDDPVQSMDDVHISQFAALVRMIAKGLDRQILLAVHDRALFDYLTLELSPAFEGDRLLTIELSKTFDGESIATPKVFTFAPDKAIAA